MMNEVKSFKEFQTALNANDKGYLLLYKAEGSEQNACSYQNLNKAVTQMQPSGIFYADVAKTRDIHAQYGITSVPVLLEFYEGKLTKTFKGCQTTEFYLNIFNQTSVKLANGEEKAPQKQVTVYSTPTCSWCNTLKNYLKDHQIVFRDIDVSRDQAAAEAMVKRSGQQGVPQTLINGEVIVGFDKARINQLLNIKNK